MKIDLTKVIARTSTNISLMISGYYWFIKPNYKLALIFSLVYVVAVLLETGEDKDEE